MLRAEPASVFELRTCAECSSRSKLRATRRERASEKGGGSESGSGESESGESESESESESGSGSERVGE
eukprot:2666099-Pleurochrysis_carterae.AAC.1